MSLSLHHIHVAFGNKTVLHDFNLHLAQGESACLLGQSGCGKTTALRVIAGFETPQSGQIMTDGRDLTNIPAHLRQIGMVFQDYALFPHLTVADNIAFGLHHLPRSERQQRTVELAELTGLTDLLKQYPHQISGGQQQRTALARALAPRPKLILLDEPFSNLDADLRTQLSQDVKKLLKQQNITALTVTHDQAEAFAVADKIGVMRNGKLVQWDTPQNIYHNPADAQIAAFIGSGSLITGQVRQNGEVQTALGCLKVDTRDLTPQTTVRVFVRPESLIVADNETVGTPAQILEQEFKGSHWAHTLVLSDGSKLLLHTAQPFSGSLLVRHQGHAVVFADNE
ncbi:MAG: ABC transporter ATP-binding protein [Alysiella sp.]|uniref:ABC transporter ATP-binding protein n=1 Tax=Alysiella sp. TaxID=1872483 RepID=UPI0026DAC4EB|nr:ABC transporter ATP-binding protein [Alysiella sp.]MDO4433124.1 ABC transporter ATP-binding protein [Alysiella sp.]